MIPNDTTHTDPTESPIGRRRQRWLYLAVLPWLYCAVYTFRYGYDTPYWDEWAKLPLVMKAFDGTIRLSDYWTLINEHRVFIPNLILIPLAKATHWNLYWELLVTLVSATLAFAIFVIMILRWEKKYDRHGTLWVVPLTALLWYSFSQHNVWTWGLHAMIAITLLFTVAMIALLSVEEISWRVLFGAALCAFAASLSFGTGVATWGAGLAMLGLHVIRSPKDGLIKAGVWLLLIAVAMAVYFIDYESTPANLSARSAFHAPSQYLLYVVAYLGGALSPFSGTLALCFGPIILLVLVQIVVAQYTRSKPIPEYARFAFGAAMMALGCGALTALKQWPEGYAHAVSSRYLPWSTLAWVGVLPLLYFAPPGRKDTLTRTVAASVAVLAVIGSLYGTYRADERHDGFLLGRQALIEHESDPAFAYLFPDPEKVVGFRADLIRYRLTIFRKTDP